MKEVIETVERSSGSRCRGARRRASGRSGGAVRIGEAHRAASWAGRRATPISTPSSAHAWRWHRPIRTGIGGPTNRGRIARMTPGDGSFSACSLRAPAPRPAGRRAGDGRLRRRVRGAGAADQADHRRGLPAPGTSLAFVAAAILVVVYLAKGIGAYFSSLPDDRRRPARRPRLRNDLFRTSSASRRRSSRRRPAG